MDRPKNPKYPYQRSDEHQYQEYRDMIPPYQEFVPMVLMDNLTVSSLNAIPTYCQTVNSTN